MRSPFGRRCTATALRNEPAPDQAHVSRRSGEREIRECRGAVRRKCFAVAGAFVTAGQLPPLPAAIRGERTIARANIALRLALALTACAMSGPLAAAELSAAQVRALLARATVEAPADLRGKDLSDIDLSGADLRHADMTGANLFGARLVSANLRGTILAGANLNGAWLMGADFSGAKLTKASLLSVVILGGEIKTMPVFAGADMRDVRMIADLPRANLAGADLTRARIGVDIRNQGMGQMRTDLSGADLSGVDFSGADLNRSLMSFAKLAGSNLRGANLFRVKLEGADLTGADVTDADFSEADLDGTILRGVKGLEHARGLERAEHYDRALR